MNWIFAALVVFVIVVGFAAGRLVRRHRVRRAAQEGSDAVQQGIDLFHAHQRARDLQNAKPHRGGEEGRGSP